MKTMKLSVKQRESIAFLLMIAGLMISFMRGGNDMLMMGIGAALTFVSIVLYILLVRCPYCGAWLGKMGENNCCRKCGEKIDDNMKY